MLAFAVSIQLTELLAPERLSWSMQRGWQAVESIFQELLKTSVSCFEDQHLRGEVGGMGGGI